MTDESVDNSPEFSALPMGPMTSVTMPASAAILGFFILVGAYACSR